MLGKAVLSRLFVVSVVWVDFTVTRACNYVRVSFLAKEESRNKALSR